MTNCRQADTHYNSRERHSPDSQIRLRETHQFCKLALPFQIKVKEGEFIHVRIYNTLPCYGNELILHGLLHHHEGGSGPIDYFEAHINLDLPKFDD
eukprot:sb/3479117/